MSPGVCGPASTCPSPLDFALPGCNVALELEVTGRPAAATCCCCHLHAAHCGAGQRRLHTRIARCGLNFALKLYTVVYYRDRLAARPMLRVSHLRVCTASWRSVTRDRDLDRPKLHWHSEPIWGSKLGDMHALLQLAAVLFLGLLGAHAQLPIPFCDVTCQQCSAVIKVGTSKKAGIGCALAASRHSSCRRRHRCCQSAASKGTHTPLSSELHLFNGLLHTAECDRLRAHAVVCSAPGIMPNWVPGQPRCRTGSRQQHSNAAVL